MRYPLVLSFGAAVGAVATIVLGMTVPAVVVGALIGAATAWTAYDLPEIIRAAPKVATTSFARTRAAWPTIRNATVNATIWLVRPRLLVWLLCAPGVVSYIIYDSFAYGLVTVLYCLVTAITCTLVLVMMAASVERTYGPTGGPFSRYLDRTMVFPANWLVTTNNLIDGGPATMHEIGLQLSTLRLLVMGCVVMSIDFTLAQLRAVYACVKRIVMLPLHLMRFVGTVTSNTMLFAWRLFVAVHSEKRLMAFVDSGTGVLVSYIVLRWHFGNTFTEAAPHVQFTFIALAAAIATAWGLFNCEVVAKLGLRLRPA